MTRSRGSRILLGALAAALFTGCGYHVAGRNPALPKNITVIAVPPMENKTTTYRIEQKLIGR